MKYIFEKEDLNPLLGKFLKHSNGHTIEMLSWQGPDSKEGRVFYLSQVNTDGWTYPIGEVKEATEFLNNNQYTPLRREDVLKEN